MHVVTRVDERSLCWFGSPGQHFFQQETLGDCAVPISIVSSATAAVALASARLLLPPAMEP